MLASREPVRNVRANSEWMRKVLHRPANDVTGLLDEQPRPDLDSEALDFRALPSARPERV